MVMPDMSALVRQTHRALRYHWNAQTDEERLVVTRSRTTIDCPRYRADDVRNDQRPIEWIPCHHRICLGQSGERGHGIRAGWHDISLVVFGHDQDFERAVPLRAVRIPVGVEVLHTTSLCACP